MKLLVRSEMLVSQQDKEGYSMLNKALGGIVPVLYNNEKSLSDILGVHTSALTDQDIAIIVMSHRRGKFDVISGRKH